MKIGIDSLISEVLIDDLRSISPKDTITPDQEVARGEQEVGKLNEKMLVLLGFSQSLFSRAAFLNNQSLLYLRDGDEAASEKAHIKSCEYTTKHEAIEKIFWVYLYDHFNLWDKDSIGVRKDFKVVWMDDESSNIQLPPPKTIQ